MATTLKGVDLDASLADASASLSISAAAEVEKTTRGTNIIGMASAVQAGVGNPAVQALEPVAMQTVQLFESQVDKLVSASDILTSALEDLARIHPFVSVVVLAFKTALKFEMTRRENDKRVMLVRAKMNDTLSVLLIIRPIAEDDTASDGKTVASRLGARLQTIAHDIQKYATLCDGFSKKRKLIKLLRSLEWETKLESFVKLFDSHKEALQEDLAIYSSRGVHQANETLSKMSLDLGTTADTVDTLYLLQLLRSPADRQLLNSIAQMGGTEKVLKDESLMQKLIKQSGDKEGEDMKTALTDVVLDFSKSFAETMQENEEMFTRKFNAWQQALNEEMQKIVRRESDRVIGAITSGPHDRIIDKDLYEVWKESGWKGTTKARNLVLGLREYYAERRKVHTLNQHQALQMLYGNTATDSSDTTAVQQSLPDAGHHTKLEDEWALDFITVSHMQPLLEAFDEDASSLVSVSEVNTFTSARPANWSLIKWMAYWAVGYPHTLIYYLRRIPILSGRIGVLAKQVRKSMPDNHFLVDYLVNDYPIVYADLITAGVYDDLQYSLFLWKHDVFDRFRDYVDDEEAKMKKKLESLKYCIDAQDTLEFVMGSPRIEKNLLPLIFLLLKRVWHVLRHAREVPLNPREIVDIVRSMDTIIDVVHTRIEHFRATSKLQNLDPEEQLRKFSHGIYHYCEELRSPKLFASDYFITYYLPSKFKLSYWPFWDQWLDEDIDFTEAEIYDPEIVIIQEDEPPEPLYYSKEDLNLHVDVYDECATQGAAFANDLTAWSGRLYTNQYDGTFSYEHSAGAWHLFLPTGGGDGQVTGSGMDGKGDFSITGRVQGSAVICNVERAMNALRFSGTLNATRDTIEGVYGTPAHDDVGNLGATLLGDSKVEGRFELRRAPMRFSYLEPSVEALASNKARALWKFAIESVMNVVRMQAGRFTWPFLQDRRRIRHRFIELYRLLPGSFPDVPSPWRRPMGKDEEHELAALVALCSKQDLQFYRKLAYVLRRRQAVYWPRQWVCESCYDGITGTQCICLDCLIVDEDSGKPSGRPMTFCLKCFLKPATRDRDTIVHVPSHSVYQLRSPPSKREEWGMLLSARDLLVAMRTADAKREKTVPECHYCQEKLEAPYWRCVECKDRICMCVSCKTGKDDMQAHEAELSFSTYGSFTTPSRNAHTTVAEHMEDSASCDAEDEVESIVDADEPMIHSFRHSLLFFQAGPQKSLDTSEEAEGSVNDVLRKLQDRVQSLDSRLERMETLLDRVLSALGSATM